MERKPKAKLLDYSVEPERNVAVAARLCYSSQDPEEIEAGFEPGEAEELTQKIMELGHHSVLEHSYFYFWVQGSRVFSHQLVRQRIGASYSQRSQRYVREDECDYVIPPSIAGNREALRIYHQHVASAQEAYKRLLELDIPQEDARFVLHQGIATNVVVSYNARSLLHFFRLRCCERAQWEIREIAEQMLNQVREVAPALFASAGPACEVEGRCPEGELSCGRVSEG